MQRCATQSFQDFGLSLSSRETHYHTHLHCEPTSTIIKHMQPKVDGIHSLWRSLCKHHVSQAKSLAPKSLQCFIDAKCYTYQSTLLLEPLRAKWGPQGSKNLRKLYNRCFNLSFMEEYTFNLMCVKKYITTSPQEMSPF